MKKRQDSGKAKFHPFYLMFKYRIVDVNKIIANNNYKTLYDGQPEYRKQKIDSFKFEKDKLLSLAAGVSFSECLKEYNINSNDCDLTHNEHGKPYLSGYNVKFNISHSGEFAVCVCSENEIGCDIEYIKEIDLNIARRKFTNLENEYIFSVNNHEDQLKRFYEIWTLKESFIKCIGTGLSLSLNDFSIVFNDKKIAVNQSFDDCEYSFEISYDIDGYIFSVCEKIKNSV